MEKTNLENVNVPWSLTRIILQIKMKWKLPLDLHVMEWF